MHAKKGIPDEWHAIVDSFNYLFPHVNRKVAGMNELAENLASWDQIDVDSRKYHGVT